MNEIYDFFSQELFKIQKVQNWQTPFGIRLKHHIK